MTSVNFAEIFRNAPPHVNVEAIQREWLAIQPPYDVNQWLLPLPVWAQRRYDQPGAQAWGVLREDLAAAEPSRPFCIYMHSPFCSTKCGYCDCYSFKLGSHKDAHLQAYVDKLCYEARLWSETGTLSQRPLTTMHMGGGTPTFLGEAGLTQIVQCCKDSFSVSEATEWALESTIESLTPGMLSTMHDLGYRRLHIGVESLEPHVRAAIGRRRPVGEVVGRIEAALALGWVVSVDLVCGLPGQSLAGFVCGIQQLIDVGVNGFSLYELLVYPQNRKWAEAHGLTERDHLPNYFMYQAGASILLEQGYRLNLFNHWADARDHNIYFTFPTRNEDCLAIGTIADGVFGDYHYRHPRYAAYLATAQHGLPGLEGGLRRDAYESEMHRLVVAIQSGRLRPELARDLQRPAASGAGSLIERWQELALIEPSPEGGYRLTTSGSWFTGNMIIELTGRYPAKTFQS